MIVQDPGSFTNASAPARERCSSEILATAREHERSGRHAEAFREFQLAIESAEEENAGIVLTEALRRLAVLRHHRNERVVARDLCQRSYQVALAINESLLAAEAMNTMALLFFEAGEMESAREKFLAALELGSAREELRGRILQNLGILANVEGDWTAARDFYQQSLAAFVHAGDEGGCALAYHNLGMISSDRALWEEADGYYVKSHAIASALGDAHLQGLCLLNHSEVHLARQHFDRARDSAEAALQTFDRLNARLDKADAYKVLGMVYRETGRTSLAESRFRDAIGLAVESGSVLSEAEASRELALLFQAMGRNQDALRFLNTAHRLFGRLNARVDLVDVGGKVAQLEGTYLAVVRDWGQSIESADSYTFGHCERVANYGIAVASALGLEESEQTTIRLGAYLHDLGKVRVPHEILNKPGKLTVEEFEIVQKHPEWGLELLSAVEFPWDIKPIIRWHHERYDGTGYPDRLKGEEIPLGAQIICIVDVYDALTTTRSYRAAMSREEAVARMEESRHWWREDVYQAFVTNIVSDPISEGG
ncbi:MAG: HD domain-containing phosphohydrolase [Gemmatimonadota bacterium]